MSKIDKIDAKEVLLYLNQLGYTNISAHILKTFLTDLKRLVKSEKHRIYDLDPFNFDKTSARNETKWITNISKPKVRGLQIKQQIENSFNDSQQQIKTNDKKLCQISLHLMNTKKKHKHCIHLEKPSNRELENDGLQSNDISETPFQAASHTIIPISKSSLKSKSTDSYNTEKHKGLNGDKLVKCVNRKDPVALYHYYQSEWKKVKFPGEEEHGTLRRTIRKKLQDDYNLKKSSR